MKKLLEKVIKEKHKKIEIKEHSGIEKIKK
jgi:hypothetical protein